MIFQGGFNTGKTVQDNCAIRDLLPELTTLAVGLAPLSVLTPRFVKVSAQIDF